MEKNLLVKHMLLYITVQILFISGLAKADAVSDWNEIANTVFLKELKPGGAAIIDMTYMHIAIYDAVNSIDKKYSVFAVEPQNSVPWASKEAAAISAAYRVLVTFYPDQQAFLDSVYNAKLNEISSGGPKTIGISIGNEVAVKFLMLREGDGRNANVPYVFGSGPGVYQLTPGAPPPPATPSTPWIAYMKPFVIDSPSQFRAPAPPALNSTAYANDFNEIKQYGSLNNSLRTKQMTETGMFYTENPGKQLSRNLRLISSAKNFSISDNARFFAQLYVTISDAVIATWESKYYYNRWRPVTAIWHADTDNNALTDPDTSWIPLAVTPNHPEYPGAHGAVTGSLAYGFEKFFGTSNVDITLTSTSVPGFTMMNHQFHDINDIIPDVINGRVYGGMHFRTSVEAGAAIALKVANWVADHKFKPVQTTSLIPTAGLQLWLTADAGMVLNGSTVSKWVDQSGNGNDAIQTDTSRQPMVVNNELNQKPVLRFDGANDRLGLTGSKLMTQITFFIVEKPVQGAIIATGQFPYYPVVFSGDNGNDYGLSMQNSYSNNSPDEIDPFIREESWVRANAVGIATFGQWKIISVTANQNMYSTTLRVNGVDALIAQQGTTNELLNFSLGNSNGTAHGGIGCADGEPHGRLTFKGDIAEVIVYDTVLSNTERLAVEKYLDDKYLINITGVEENNLVPDKYSLQQNYPNPFNPSTTINYSLAKEGNVKLTVYDALGRMVETIVNEYKPAGNHSVKFNAANLASGIYLYRLESGPYSSAKKLIFVK